MPRVGSRSVPAQEALPANEADGHDLDVVAIGSPLLDVIELATDEQLARVGLEKGSMTLIDLATANAVQEFMGAPRFVSGGSVANTTAGIAVLGGTAGFVGAVADDEVGRTYTENLRAAGVEFEPHLSESAAADGLGTGRCVVLITEDADRTMGTYLGAASTLSPEGVPTLLRGPRLHRPARGLPLGRAGGQGGDAPRRGHRARGRGLGRTLAVRPLLRGTPPSGSSSISCSTTWTSCSATRRRSPCSSGSTPTRMRCRRRRRPGCSSS